VEYNSSTFNYKNKPININASLSRLILYNNGKFRSTKQRDFIHKFCSSHLVTDESILAVINEYIERFDVKNAMVTGLRILYQTGMPGYYIYVLDRLGVAMKFQYVEGAGVRKSFIRFDDKLKGS
jgi:hypothetical protein